MRIIADSPEHYIGQLPTDRQVAITELRNVIKENLPPGFAEIMQYDMISFVIPHSLYPGGYHCDPKQPLPFLSIASQKNFIAVYHMGIYADAKILEWFTEEYKKQSPIKLDMGKSCIRFKKPEKIPFQLIGELAKKITPQQWIKTYEENIKR